MRWQTVDIFGPLLVNVVYEHPLISCIKKQFYVFFGVLEGEEEDLLYGQLQKFEVEIFKTAHKGQIKSEWKYEVKIFPNYQRKNLMDFCPASLCRLASYVGRYVALLRSFSTEKKMCLEIVA